MGSQAKAQLEDSRHLSRHIKRGVNGLSDGGSVRGLQALERMHQTECEWAPKQSLGRALQEVDVKIICKNGDFRLDVESTAASLLPNPSLEQPNPPLMHVRMGLWRLNRRN
jgi:hypothetical protein